MFTDHKARTTALSFPSTRIHCTKKNALIVEDLNWPNIDLKLLNGKDEEKTHQNDGGSGDCDGFLPGSEGEGGENREAVII